MCATHLPLTVCVLCLKCNLGKFVFPDDAHDRHMFFVQWPYTVAYSCFPVWHCVFYFICTLHYLVPVWVCKALQITKMNALGWQFSTLETLQWCTMPCLEISFRHITVTIRPAVVNEGGSTPRRQRDDPQPGCGERWGLTAEHRARRCLLPAVTNVAHRAWWGAEPSGQQRLRPGCGSTCLSQ